jgi:DNA-binding NtrC family response regulator
MGELRPVAERSRPQLSKPVKELPRITSGPTVLVIEPNPDRQWRAARLVTLLGHRVIGTSSLGGAFALLAACPVQMVLVDEELCDGDVRGMVADLKALQPDCRVTVMTAPESSGSGVHPARLEFVDYVPQPLVPDDLKRLLVRLV